MGMNLTLALCVAKITNGRLTSYGFPTRTEIESSEVKMGMVEIPCPLYIGTLERANSKIEEIQALIDEMTPDLLYITEANYFSEFPDHLTHIPGYRQVHPKQLVTMKYSRIVLLVRDGIQVTILEDLMCPEVASIWLKIAKRGCRKFHLGGVYREHMLLRSTDNTDHSSIH